MRVNLLTEKLGVRKKNIMNSSGGADAVNQSPKKKTDGTTPLILSPSDIEGEFSTVMYPIPRVFIQYRERRKKRRMTSRLYF